MPDSKLQKEIFEQPEAFARLLDRESEQVLQMALRLKRRGIRYLTMAARGSSDNAVTYGKYAFGVLARMPVVQAAPALYTIYKQPPELRDSLLIAISQSGESTDILGVLEEGRRQGVPTLVITNEADSSMAHAAEEVILLHAGLEESVAATKTYSNSLGALALLAAGWAGVPARFRELQSIPERMREALEQEPSIAAGANDLQGLEECEVIGRGFNYATAFEIALKLKELAYVHAEPYSSADFMHGPIAVVDPDFTVILVAPDGEVFPSLLEFGERLSRGGVRLIAISDRPELAKLAYLTWPVPSGPEWLSPMVSVIPGQLLALRLTQAKGNAVDRPRGITKVTWTL